MLRDDEPMDEKKLKSATISGLIWKLAERVGSQAVTMIVSILLARLLSPSDFGAVALITVFINIANMFVISGLGTALIQKKDADNIDFSSVFFANFFISLVIYAVFFFSAPAVADFYGIAVLEPALRVLALRIPLSAVNTIQTAYVSRHMLFKHYFFATLYGTVISTVIGLSMAYAGLGVWALVGQQLSATVAGTVTIWFSVRWRPQLVFSWERMKGLFNYGWKLLCSGMIFVIYQEFTNLVIGKAFTARDLGYYSNGNKYMNNIVTTVNDSISAVLFPVMSRHQDDREKVKSITRRTLRTTSYILFPVLGGIIIVSRPLILLLMTSKWLPSVIYMQIACVVLAFYPMNTANMEAVKALGHSSLNLTLEIIKRVIGIAAIFIALPYGVVAVAASAVATTLISTLINAVAIKGLLGYRYGEQALDIFPPLAMTVLMCCAVRLFGFLGLPDIVLIALQAISGAALYLGMSLLFRVESFAYLKKTALEFLLRRQPE